MTRVLLIEDLDQVAEHLKGLLAREQGVRVIGVQSSPETGVAQAIADRPDVVFVDALLQAQGRLDGLEVARRIRAGSPGTRIVMVTVPQRVLQADPDKSIDAVLTLPGSANDLSSAIGASTKGSGALSRGQTVARYSPKGGTGKTTIALNLACALRRDGNTVALMDGVMQFGAMRHILAAPPETRSIIDLPPGAPMKSALPEVLREGPAGIDVLFAPERPEQADLVQPAEIANAMVLLAAVHDYVIVDAPTRLADDTLAIFDAASIILIVSTYMDVTVRNVRAAVDTFTALGYKGQKPLLVVVNQGDNLPGMSRPGLERELGLPVVAEIPADWKTVSESLNARQPYVLSAPATAVAKAVGALAATLVAQQRR